MHSFRRSFFLWLFIWRLQAVRLDDASDSADDVVVGVAATAFSAPTHVRELQSFGHQEEGVNIATISMNMSAPSVLETELTNINILATSSSPTSSTTDSPLQTKMLASTREIARTDARESSPLLNPIRAEAMLDIDRGYTSTLMGTITKNVKEVSSQAAKPAPIQAQMQTQLQTGTQRVKGIQGQVQLELGASFGDGRISHLHESALPLFVAAFAAVFCCVTLSVRPASQPHDCVADAHHAGPTVQKDNGTSKETKHTPERLGKIDEVDEDTGALSDISDTVGQAKDIGKGTSGRPHSSNETFKGRPHSSSGTTQRKRPMPLDTMEHDPAAIGPTLSGTSDLTRGSIDTNITRSSIDTSGSRSSIDSMGVSSPSGRQRRMSEHAAKRGEWLDAFMKIQAQLNKPRRSTAERLSPKAGQRESLATTVAKVLKEKQAPSKTAQIAEDPQIIEFEPVAYEEEDVRRNSIGRFQSLSDPLWQGHLWKLNSAVSFGDLEAMPMLEKSWRRRWFVLAYGKDMQSSPLTKNLKLLYYSEKDDHLEHFCDILDVLNLFVAPSVKVAPLTPDALQRILADTRSYDLAFTDISDGLKVIPRKLYPIKISSTDESLIGVNADDQKADEKVVALSSQESCKGFMSSVERALSRGALSSDSGRESM